MPLKPPRSLTNAGHLASHSPQPHPALSTTGAHTTVSHHCNLSKTAGASIIRRREIYRARPNGFSRSSPEQHHRTASSKLLLCKSTSAGAKEEGKKRNAGESHFRLGQKGRGKAAKGSRRRPSQWFFHIARETLSLRLWIPWGRQCSAPGPDAGKIRSRECSAGAVRDWVVQRHVVLVKR
jgi:hypothetical protein